MLRLLPLFVLVAAAMASLKVLADESEQPRPWEWMLGVHSNYQYTLDHPQNALVNRVRLIEAVDTEGVVLLSSYADLSQPDTVVRHRVYQFINNRKGWVQHTFELPTEVTGSQLSDPTHWQRLHGCSLQWKYKDNHFVAHNNPKQCYFLRQETKQRIAVSSEVYLFRDHFTLQDQLQIHDLENNVVSEENILTDYQRTRFYAIEASYSTQENEWQDVVTSVQLHDQGARSGLVLKDSGLELRYQVELRRDGGKLKFMIHDISRDTVIHEQSFAADIDVFDYASDRLRLRIKPHP